MVEWLTEPLAYSFVLRGLLAGVLAGAACALLSAFIVWRGMAFIGDAIAHSILPGIVVAFVAGFSLFLGALVAAVLAAVGIGMLTRGGRLKEDTAIGVIFTGLFALGVLLLSRITSYQDLGHILLGNILGVGRGELIAMGAMTALVVLAVSLFYKELLVTSFDPSHAVVIGLSPELVRHGLLVLIALTVVAAIQVVGVVLVLALLVTPGAAASLVSRRLPRIIGLSVILSTVSALIGFYVSYYLDVASGAAIVLTLTLFFAVLFVLSPRSPARKARG
jgi:ABC-type Mn2+/Zn2+ transport system permease subunit